jgi:hypothetical protein
MNGNEMSLMASIAVDIQNKEVDEVLDKIRFEIVHLHDWAFSREEILRIIDKYKSESEE